MSERRYVVELTKPVQGTELTTAAGQIARRLGLDVGRVATLLRDRVGPVTKPVLAPKADAIAQVFQDAGVDVAVYDANASPYETAWDREPAAESAPAPADEPEEAAAPEDASQAEGEPRAYGYEAPPPLPPDIDRWDSEDPWGGMDPWRDAAYHPPGSENQVEEVTGPTDHDERSPPTEDTEGSREQAPAAGDQWPLPPTQTTSFVRPAVWQEGRPEARGRSALRVYMLVALALAAALLLALQFVYRDQGGAGPAYEDGLAAYRVGDFEGARRAWIVAAEDGSAQAQFMLGHMAQHGLGRPWSFREAAQRYAVAAEAGLADAQLALGELYLDGLGVQPDAEAGMAWLRTAAASGYAPALLRFGEAALHGEGGARDFDAAIAAFEAAATAGSTKAADYLAFARHLAGRSGMMVP